MKIFTLIFAIILLQCVQTKKAYAESPMLPDSTLTPGDTIPGALQNICKPHYTKAVRDVSQSKKERVYKLYKIYHHERGEYEVDHLIPLELGGSNDIKNLWPESYLTEPWNAHKKDRLENRLKRLVCIEKLTLPEAQQAIAHNWIEAYKKYIEEPANKKRK